MASSNAEIALELAHTTMAFIGVVVCLHTLSDAKTEQDADKYIVPQTTEEAAVLDVRRTMNKMYVVNAWWSFTTVLLMLLIGVVEIITPNKHVPPPVSVYIIATLRALVALSLITSVERARRIRAKNLRRDILALKDHRAKR